MIEVKVMVCLLLLFMPQLLCTEVMFNKRSWIKNQALNSIIQHSCKLLPNVSAFKTQIGEEKFGNKSYDVKFHPLFTHPDVDFFSKPENHLKPLAILYYGRALSSGFENILNWAFDESRMQKYTTSLLKTSWYIMDRILEFLETYAQAIIKYFKPKAPPYFKVPATQPFRHHLMMVEKSGFFHIVKIKGLKKRVCQKSPPSQCEQNVMGFVIVRDFAKLLQAVIRYAKEIKIRE